MMNEQALAAVEMAKAMRAAGVQKFSFDGQHLSCELSPPDPKPLTEIVERISELSPQHRKELLDEAKKDLDRDLYGASL